MGGESVYFVKREMRTGGCEGEDRWREKVGKEGWEGVRMAEACL